MNKGEPTARRLLAPGGAGNRAVQGRDNSSMASPSVLTALTERAARRNNEMLPREG
jgi:hypothetical protein